MIILFAVGADNQGAEGHLRMLAMFSKKLGNDAVVSQLMKADTAEDVIHTFLTDPEMPAEEPESEEEELDLDEISIL